MMGWMTPLRLLRPNGARPSSRSAAEQRDEFPPSHAEHGGFPPHQRRRPVHAVGPPHAQPAAGRLTSPWRRPELF
jgi:hypothetical protein